MAEPRPAVTTLQFNTTVRFGRGARSLLPGELRALGIGRPLVVTDRGVIAAGVLALALGDLRGDVFNATPANPTEDSTALALAQYREADADGIIGIGGGAALDLAKAVAVMAGSPPGHEGTLWEYCNRHAAPRPIQSPPPLILLPTTAGSGSEVGRSAVIIFRNGIKAGIGCPRIVSLAICDPDLTLTLPPGMTAATGMDALSHCVETFCSPTINPPVDAIVLDGLARLSAAITLATANGSDHAARWDMMMGALEGAIGFQKGMGAVHSLSHALGPLGFHHGTLNAVLLPPVMAANQDVLGDKLGRLRTAMRLPIDADIPEAFAALNASLGLPSGLGAMGFDRSMIPAIALAAMDDNAHRTNPQPLGPLDYEAILNHAL
ncbi:iron-containing alcohol dehydrogenase [Acidisphaera sp. L21]|uniref:iron-containing alcohol dehydrogenase n=1 Tax=Acidisphaera sp. L21 TaxID=1641851 RepID=UPI00131B17A7|nr:iron-containing alcohol dehydrogenase [Acidisphaera sp. L21]